MPTSKAVVKPRHAQQIAIRTRRKRVHYLLQQRKPLREIAEVVGVTVETVIQDKKAIAKELAAQHFEVKAIDLDDLDVMEAEAMEQVATWVKRSEDLWKQAEVDGSDDMPKGFATALQSARDWWAKRLEIKKTRGKWLGYELVEKQPDVQVDNRSVTINVTDPTSGGTQPFGEWVKGVIPGANTDTTTTG